MTQPDVKCTHCGNSEHFCRTKADLPSPRIVSNPPVFREFKHGQGANDVSLYICQMCGHVAIFDENVAGVSESDTP